MTQEHTYRPFDADIDRLRSAVTVMGGLVERQLVRAVDAVRLRDLDRVAQVLTDEAMVNQLHLETDLRCNQVIAKRQPIAVDLREIVCVIHMINDLERIGDEAKKIAKKARELERTEQPPVPLDEIQAMAELVLGMLRQAIDAFVRHDSALARSLVERDERVDAMRDDLLRRLMERMTQDSAAVSASLSMVFVVQSIERIGDHVKNIAEFVVNVVEGVDPRYSRSRQAEA